MTKSTITRERIQRIIRAIDSESYDEEEIREWLTSDEIMGLARMALAAMDSESGCLPLDYLQGTKTVWNGPPNWQKPITLKQENGCTMTLSSWQKPFAKVQICRQCSR